MLCHKLPLLIVEFANNERAKTLQNLSVSAASIVHLLSSCRVYFLQVEIMKFSALVIILFVGSHFNKACYFLSSVVRESYATKFSCPYSVEIYSL